MDVNNEKQKSLPIITRWLLVLSYDTLAIIVTWFATFILHDNFRTLSLHEYQLTFSILPIVTISYFASFILLKTYRGVWGYSSISDLSRLIKSLLIGCLLANTACLYFNLSSHFIRSNLIVHAALLLLMTGGARMFYRRLSEKLSKVTDKQKRVLIIGAGHAGEGILRDILRNKQLGYKPVGILDDQRNKLGQEIHRVRVLGVTRQLSEFVEKLAVDLVIIATPSTTSKTMRRLVNYCHQAKVEYRTLPGLRDIASGNVSVNDLREVQIEDLLGRDQVQTDRNNITRTLLHKKVLVSGGGGSIGSELCRQIAQNNPAQIIVIENCEFKKIVK